jgi:small subunit ribosomal protein S2
VVEADNEVGLQIIETLGDEEEDIENILTDVSIKEEDREIDIASYSSEAPLVASVGGEVHEEHEEDELPVDVDKVYDEA